MRYTTFRFALDPTSAQEQVLAWHAGAWSCGTWRPAAFYAAALEDGGRHRGAPGVWVQYSERYYAAYVWDPDDNNIEAVFHSPESLAAVAPVRQPQDAS